MSLTAAQTAKVSPLGFQPGLVVDDPLAAHWLRQATLRLRREITWLWHERGTLSEVKGGGVLPPFMDKISETLDLVRYESDRQTFYAEDSTAAWLTEQIGKAAPKAPCAPRGSFSWLVEALQLTDVDCFALALALGGVLDRT